ncbi:hypothetical protein LSAT2_029094, partial [Lamellibrachia satsuma]
NNSLRRMFINAFIPEELRASVTVSVIVDEAEMQRSRSQLMSQGTSLTSVVYMRAPDVDQRFLPTWAAKYMKTELTYARDVKCHKTSREKQRPY